MPTSLGRAHVWPKAPSCSRISFIRRAAIGTAKLSRGHKSEPEQLEQLLQRNALCLERVTLKRRCAMNGLSRYSKFALVLLFVPGMVLAQGKSGDKGKGKDKKVERVEGGEVVKVRGDGKDKGKDKDKDKDRVVRTVIVPAPTTTTIVTTKPQKAKVKHVTTLQAVGVTRDVLVTNGYRVVQVVPSGSSQIIYYRRGNMGNGRGLGPVERLVVVPS